MKPRASLVLLVVTTLLMLVPSVFADSQARIVRLSFSDGLVQIDRATGHFEKAIINMPIIQGTKLATDTAARAEVEFEDGSTIRLGPESEMVFTDLSLRDNGGKVNRVELVQGTAYFDISRHKEDEFQVAFAGDQVTLDRNARFRITVNQDRVELAVLNGELKVQGTEEVAVKKNQTLEIDSENGKFEVAKGVAEDPLDDWVKAREEYRDRYAANASYGAPYSGYYGLGDLNYYGSYAYQSGWGWLWRPYYVGANWDPFYDGAWCWYPGYGYTWVSNYSWGWIPYRYGSWVYVPGWGWAWQPGGWSGWRTVPVVVNAPPLYRPPQPPVAPTVPVRPTPQPGTGPSIGPIGPRPPHPTVLVRAHAPIGENPVIDVDRGPRGAIRSFGATQPAGTQTLTQPGVPTQRVTDDGQVRTRPAYGPSGRTPDSRVERTAPSPRVDRPSSPSPRIDRPSSPPPRIERPSAPPPRIERSSPPPRMEAPRAAPPPRMESPRSSSPPPRPNK